MEESQLPKVFIGNTDTHLSVAIDRKKHLFFIGLQSTVTNEKKEDLVSNLELYLSYDEAAALSNIISAWLSYRG